MAEKDNNTQGLSRLLGALSGLLVLCTVLLVGLFGLAYAAVEHGWYYPKGGPATTNGGPGPGPVVVNGIDVATGLVAADGFEVVKTHCTACHSAQLVTQNRATREGWQSMIRWMQQTQGLWELGANEPTILDYLAKHYAPSQVGRRANLADVEWYMLEQEEQEEQAP